MNKYTYNHTVLRYVLACIICFTSICTIAQAQQSASDGKPVRTPMEIARKQTAMLQRELDLTELQVDTVYKIHLKYAIMREVSNTRKEMLERMNAMTEELLQVMTKIQREKFLNKQLDADSRRPHAIGRLMRDSIGGSSPIQARK